MKFNSSLFSSILYFDGAMGSMLSNAGLTAGECPELWNLDHPDAVREIHAAYVAAGSNIVETNTLGANAYKLDKFGLKDRVAELNTAAVKNARASGAQFVAASMGPTGTFLYPYGDLSYDALYAIYVEQARALRDAGADVLFIETMMDLSEARVAMLAAKALRIPFIPSFTFQENGSTLMGNTPEALAVYAQQIGAAAVGINCSGGPKELLPVLKRMRPACALPICVQPNAGIPTMTGGETVFPLSAADMASMMRDIILSGANAIGGCCGTTPEHISLMKQATADLSPTDLNIHAEAHASTARGTVELSRALGAVHAICADDAVRIADEVMDAPASAESLLLDISCARESEIVAIVAEAQQYSRIPLSFKADDPRLIEAALKAYCGISAVDSNEASDSLLEMYGANRI